MMVAFEPVAASSGHTIAANGNSISQRLGTDLLVDDKTGAFLKLCSNFAKLARRL
jgi:hypothetical protein